uniref:Uncharacterized protein n=1 Tax=Trichuris muris TaxID=70415 RepID=A0A5S6PZL0_TRIMR
MVSAHQKQCGPWAPLIAMIGFALFVSIVKGEEKSGEPAVKSDASMVLVEPRSSVGVGKADNRKLPEDPTELAARLKRQGVVTQFYPIVPAPEGTLEKTYYYPEAKSAGRCGCGCGCGASAAPACPPCPPPPLPRPCPPCPPAAMPRPCPPCPPPPLQMPCPPCPPPPPPRPCPPCPAAMPARPCPPCPPRAQPVACPQGHHRAADVDKGADVDKSADADKGPADVGKGPADAGRKAADADKGPADADKRAAQVANDAVAGASLSDRRSTLETAVNSLPYNPPLQSLVKSS